LLGIVLASVVPAVFQTPRDASPFCHPGTSVATCFRPALVRCSSAGLHSSSVSPLLFPVAVRLRWCLLTRPHRVSSFIASSLAPRPKFQSRSRRPTRRHPTVCPASRRAGRLQAADNSQAEDSPDRSALAALAGRPGPSNSRTPAARRSSRLRDGASWELRSPSSPSPAVSAAHRAHPNTLVHDHDAGTSAKCCPGRCGVAMTRASALTLGILPSRITCSQESVLRSPNSSDRPCPHLLVDLPERRDAVLRLRLGRSPTPTPYSGPSVRSGP